ncbi:hypothetical protein [Sporosarcina sp. BP05]|uniref:helix-turn-helix domain-containing protein n=1 Tax=Sporosarcina sp. BP05 TaxID=2758726 RepID=UPI0016479DFE|nr:hypothetical protein [Sporosarcina sp. BP05]
MDKGVVTIEKKRIAVIIPESLKDQLKNMSEELGVSQSQLAVLAIQSLVANYESKGSQVFLDLIQKH